MMAEGDGTWRTAFEVDDCSCGVAAEAVYVDGVQVRLLTARALTFSEKSFQAEAVSRCAGTTEPVVQRSS